MSMLSAQIDELRAMAQLEKNLERPAIARILGDAADTIWELRDDLQRANDSLQDAEHDESVAWDRVRKAEAESAKLRLLAKAMRTYQYMDTDADPLAALQLSNAITVMYDELGIEVPS